METISSHSNSPITLKVDKKNKTLEKIEITLNGKRYHSPYDSLTLDSEHYYFEKKDDKIIATSINDDGKKYVISANNIVQIENNIPVCIFRCQFYDLPIQLANGFYTLDILKYQLSEFDTDVYYAYDCRTMDDIDRPNLDDLNNPQFNDKNHPKLNDECVYYKDGDMYIINSRTLEVLELLYRAKKEENKEQLALLFDELIKIKEKKKTSILENININDFNKNEITNIIEYINNCIVNRKEGYRKDSKLFFDNVMKDIMTESIINWTKTEQRDKERKQMAQILSNLRKEANLERQQKEQANIQFTKQQDNNIQSSSTLLESIRIFEAAKENEELLQIIYDINIKKKQISDNAAQKIKSYTNFFDKILDLLYQIFINNRPTKKEALINSTNITLKQLLDVFNKYNYVKLRKFLTESVDIINKDLDKFYDNLNIDNEKRQFLSFNTKDNKYELINGKQVQKNIEANRKRQKKEIQNNIIYNKSIEDLHRLTETSTCK